MLSWKLLKNITDSTKNSIAKNHMMKPTDHLLALLKTGKTILTTMTVALFITRSWFRSTLAASSAVKTYRV